jgi:hypothetical protein
MELALLRAEHAELANQYEFAVEALEQAGRLLSTLVWTYGSGTDAERILEVSVVDDVPVFGVHAQVREDGWTLICHRHEEGS